MSITFQNGMHVMTGILFLIWLYFYHIMQKLIKGFLKNIYFKECPPDRPDLRPKQVEKGGNILDKKTNRTKYLYTMLWPIGSTSVT